MRHCAIILAASMLLPFSVSAQAIKCIGAGGKVTYSDTPCQDGSSGQNVNTQSNVMDGSYERRAASVARDEDAVQRSTLSTSQREQEINAIVRNPPAQCKFAHFAFSDSKGKEMAALAKRECTENIIAERNGDPAKERYYRLWQDHHNTVSKRRAAITANNRTLKCTPDMLGGATCR